MSGNNWAIVVGINQYEHLTLDDHLKYAVKDALAMQTFLCDQAQFSADNVLVCCDPQVASTRRPSRSGLRHLLRHELQRAREADNFWFFYAGHGIVHNHQDFLLPCDGNPYDLEETAIPISFVTDCLRDCEAHNVVLVLDMCRNRTRSSVEDGSRDIGTDMGEQTLEITREQGLVTLFSCSRGQRSYEIKELEQGAFTHTLLAGLKESTTPRVLEQYLTNRLPALNRQYGKPVQVPLVVPEPGWKYDRPLLLSLATATETELLVTQAEAAERKDDYEVAESLWWQVIEAVQSTPSDRTTARKALKRLGEKRKAQLQPQPETKTQLEVQLQPKTEPQLESEAAEQVQPETEPEPQSAVETKPSQTTTPTEPSQMTTMTLVMEEAAVKPPVMQSTSVSERADGSESSQPTASPRTPPSDLSQTVPTTPGFQPFEFDVLTVNAEGQETSRKRGQAEYFTEDLGNGVGLEMVAIPGGSFLMGSPGEGRDDEKPQHSVTVQPFLMGKYPITQAQWRAVAALPKLKCHLKSAPSHFQVDKRPVEHVSWDEAVEFCDRLSFKTAREYRLPSEAEWEYACRAGTTTPFHFGETITTDLVNYDGNDTYRAEPKGESRRQTTDVGSFPPNAFGLYDMHGNVLEWCVDRHHHNYWGAPTDGRAWAKGGTYEHQVLRGGAWYSTPTFCRSACRKGTPPGEHRYFIGFRVVCAFARTP